MFYSPKLSISQIRMNVVWALLKLKVKHHSLLCLMVGSRKTLFCTTININHLFFFFLPFFMIWMIHWIMFNFHLHMELLSNWWKTGPPRLFARKINRRASKSNRFWIPRFAGLISLCGTQRLSSLLWSFCFIIEVQYLQSEYF